MLGYPIRSVWFRTTLHTLQSLALVSGLAITFLCAPVRAHEIQPSIANAAVNPDEFLMAVRGTFEVFMAKMDVSGIHDTNDSPQADEYNRLRALTEEAFKAELTARWGEVAQTFNIKAGDVPLVLELHAIEVLPQPDASLARESIVTFKAVMPPGDTPVTIGWDPANGPLVVRQVGAGDDAYTAYLRPGEVTLPIPRVGVLNESGTAAFVNKILLGFTHILPKGLDHILFVLGLFFFSRNLRPLLIQITAFTLAHTVTLALATLKIVSVPASIVEPLIALSIAWVAVENILWQRLTIWRTLIVFGFGLLHGLGFASFLGEIGLSPLRLVTELIGFNVGVEFGQLTVVALAYLLVARWFGDQPWYRQRVVFPISLAIAAMGLFWAAQRTGFI